MGPNGWWDVPMYNEQCGFSNGESRSLPGRCFGCSFYGRYTDTRQFQVLKTISSGLQTQLPPDITFNATSFSSFPNVDLIHLSRATALGSGVNGGAVPKQRGVCLVERVYLYFDTVSGVCTVRARTTAGLLLVR